MSFQKDSSQVQNNKLDSFQEAPLQKSKCFLKLKTNTISVRDSTFSQTFGKAVIRYNIEQSKIIGDVQIAHLYVFRKSDREMIFNSDEESFTIKQNLRTAICVEAKKNLALATLSCGKENVSSWGSIMMIINFLPPK